MDCRNTHIKIIRKRSMSVAIEQQRTTPIQFLHSQYIKAAPQSPQNLTITETRATEVDLDWTEPAFGAWDDFTIYVQEIDTGNIIQQVEGIEGTATTIFGLGGETDYEFWVVSVRDGIESDQSNHVTTTTPSECDLTIGEVLTEEMGNTKALSFDGEDDYVAIANLSHGESATIQATIEITEDLGTFHAIAGQGYLQGTEEGIGLGIFIRDDLRPTFQSRNNTENVSAIPSGNFLSLNTKYVITGVRNSSTNKCQLYLDGELIAEATGEISTIQGDQALFGIGQRRHEDTLTWGFPFAGVIDEAQLWNYALSQAEIKNNSLNILNGDEDGLIGYWNCEDEASSLTDLTANNNHGTINGAVYSDDTYNPDVTTVDASSTNTPIEYSIWNQAGDTVVHDWQESNEFVIEDTGTFLAKCRDANSCTDEKEFIIS